MKIFRKFRLSMLKDNKFFKYMLYAFGEIVLVVIGILFAIQIDQWNSLAERHRNNKIHLEQLIEDLKKDKKRLNNLMFGGPKGYAIGYKNAIANCDTAIKLSYQGMDSIAVKYMLSIQFQSGGIIGVEDGVYSELVNTSKLYTLGSDTLIKAIKKYYTDAKKEDYYNKLSSNFVDEAYIKNVAWNNIVRDLTFSKDFSISDYTWLNNPRSEEYIQFQSNLSEMKDNMTANFLKVREILATCEELITLTESELEFKE